jgi:hypothetical protein
VTNVQTSRQHTKTKAIVHRIESFIHILRVVCQGPNATGTLNYSSIAPQTATLFIAYSWQWQAESKKEMNLKKITIKLPSQKTPSPKQITLPKETGKNFHPHSFFPNE